MNPTDLGYLVQFAFLIGALLFAMGLHLMNSPASARNGNRLSAIGMTIAVISELVFVANSSPGIGNWAIIVGGLAVGGAAGLRLARTVAMTAMPQLVSLFNAMGGGAAALLAIDDFVRLSGQRTPGRRAGEPGRLADLLHRRRCRRRLGDFHRLADRDRPS